MISISDHRASQISRLEYICSSENLCTRVPLVVPADVVSQLKEDGALLDVYPSSKLNRLQGLLFWVCKGPVKFILLPE